MTTLTIPKILVTVFLESWKYPEAFIPAVFCEAWSENFWTWKEKLHLYTCDPTNLSLELRRTI